MKISDYRLSGEQVNYKESPNRSGRFAAGSADSIVVHFTGGASAQSSVNHLLNPAAKASAHLVVGRDGAVTQLVPFDTVAWHAGRSSFRGRSGFNQYSIGIEIDNAGRLSRSGDAFVSWFGRSYPADEVIEAVHRNEREPAFWHRYSEQQIERVEALCALLIETYDIDMIVGHEEIAPQRKTDPGPAFPLDQLRERTLVRDRGVDEDDASSEPHLSKVGLVSADKLNIRATPGGATVAPPLTKGTLVNVIQEKDGWYEVEVTTKGWVSGQYVKT
ncbi:MAG: N-acetylmuramoyl-L-alanine amidase [Gammaproteobacteria bacterium]|nr:N-acetylmuramoyl-L-alanine amidase [Gammaproteobacteria bacterium]